VDRSTQKKFRFSWTSISGKKNEARKHWKLVESGWREPGHNAANEEFVTKQQNVWGAGRGYVKNSKAF